MKAKESFIGESQIDQFLAFSSEKNAFQNEIVTRCSGSHSPCSDMREK